MSSSQRRDLENELNSILGARDADAARIITDLTKHKTHLAAEADGALRKTQHAIQRSTSSSRVRLRWLALPAVAVAAAACFAVFFGVENHNSESVAIPTNHTEIYSSLASPPTVVVGGDASVPTKRVGGDETNNTEWFRAGSSLFEEEVADLLVSALIEGTGESETWTVSVNDINELLKGGSNEL